MQIHQSLKEGKKENCLQAGDLEIYPDSYKAFKKGKILDLTGRNLRFLCFLPGIRILPFPENVSLTGSGAWKLVGDMATVTVHINNLRDKIEEDPSNPQMIQTIWGVGYRFHPA